jgi:hypothetical protein
MVLLVVAVWIRCERFLAKNNLNQSINSKYAIAFRMKDTSERMNLLVQYV